MKRKSPLSKRSVSEGLVPRTNMASQWNNKKAIRLQQAPKVMLDRENVARHGEIQMSGKEYRFSFKEKC
jgi:hypothetical protein